MPNYEYFFVREIVSTEYFCRVIEAPDVETSFAIATGIAFESDNAVPDDVTESEEMPEFGAFCPNLQGETTEEPDVFAPEVTSDQESAS